MKIYAKIALIILFALGGNLFGKDEISEIYPKALENQVMKVINLPKINDENKFLLKITFGKMMEVNCNDHFFINLKLDKKMLDGYGYNYFVLSGDYEVATTLMQCENDKEVTRFVEFDPKLFLPYKSNLALVFYVPKDFLIKTRIYELKKTQILDK